jgi:hypothetical protein
LPFDASDNALRRSNSSEEAHASATDGGVDACSRGTHPVTPHELIASHDFRYPGSEFRILMFAGRLLPQPASTLVHQAYSRLGYDLRETIRPQKRESAATAVLQVVHDGRTLGTLSVNLDSAFGLDADALYREQIDQFRMQGTSCEFTRLALDTELAGREVLCSLFYMAYVFSHVVHRARHLFIEVNPRHQVFYERMLGFRRLGEEKLCLRVGAPAVLLHLDFQFTKEQLQRFRQGLGVVGTTLYRYAVPAAEERLLVNQMSTSSPC